MESLYCLITMLSLLVDDPHVIGEIKHYISFPFQVAATLSQAVMSSTNQMLICLAYVSKSTKNIENFYGSHHLFSLF